MRNISNILVYGTTPDNYGNPVNTTSFSIAASGMSSVDVDLWACNNAQFLIQETYPKTASTSGISVDVAYGFGAGDPLATGPIPCVLGGSSVPLFSDNTDAISMAPVLSSASPVTKRTFFSLADLRTSLPRWIRMLITNTDATNAVTVSIYTDT